MWTFALGQAQALPYLPEELQAIILDFVRESTLPARKRRLFARVHEELKLYPFGTGFREQASGLNDRLYHVSDHVSVYHVTAVH